MKFVIFSSYQYARTVNENDDINSAGIGDGEELHIIPISSISEITQDDDGRNTIRTLDGIVYNRVGCIEIEDEAEIYENYFA